MASESEPLTILLVDDDNDIRNLLEIVFESEGYVSFSCHDGFSGWETFKNKQSVLDIVVTDLKMPNRDGYELAGDIRKESDDIPILMLTASGLSSNLRQKIQDRVDDIIAKPFEIDDVLAKVNSLVQLRRARIQERLNSDLSV